MYDPVKKCFEYWVEAGNSPVNVNGFKEEYLKFAQICKSIRAFKVGKSCNMRITLNQIIVFYNVFGLKTTTMLFEVCPQEYWSEIKTLLNFLGYIPKNQVIPFMGGTINLKGFEINQVLAQHLTDLTK